MMFEAVLSIAVLLCLVLVLLGCLDCLFKKKRFEAFGNRDSGHAQHNAAFSVDIFDADNVSEQVVIEPLPDILSKVTVVPVLRPRITCAERGKQEATLSLLSVQRSFPRSRVKYLNEIGSGWFGKAIESEANHIVPGSDATSVVVKMLKDDASKLEQKQFMEEVNAFRCLDHANLLSFLGQCTETAPFLVILEFAAHGNLKSYLAKHRLDVDTLIASNRLVNFALDAASGLACLHRHDYIHNDLAARNCLVMADYTLKIGDYGISDHLHKDEYFSTGHELLPVRWMAPETLLQIDGVWSSQNCSRISDMWSFGVLLWEICSIGERPYGSLTDEAVLQNVVQDRLVLPSDTNSKLPFKVKMWSVMIQCWEEPSQRLQVEQAHHVLEQLKIHSDIMADTSDFDQKWNHLDPNQAKIANTRLENTSTLANTSVVDIALEKPSFFSHELNVPDEVRKDDVILEMDNYLTPVSPSRDIDEFAVPKSSTHPLLTSADHTFRTVQQNGSLDAYPYQVMLENELKRVSSPLSHIRPTSSLDQPKTASPLAVSKGSASASQFYSTHSSPSSEYMTVDETHGDSDIHEETLKELSIADGDLSLDSEGMSIHESIDDTLKDSFSPGENSIGNNNNNIFILPFHEGGENFSDFVHTSPDGPDIKCTDFEPVFPTAGDSLIEAKGVHEDELCNKDASILRTNIQSSDDFTCTDDRFSEVVAYVDSITHVNSDRNEFADISNSTSPTCVDGLNYNSESSNLFDYVNSYDTVTNVVEESSELSNLQTCPEVQPVSDHSQNIFINAQDHCCASSVLHVSGLDVENESDLDMVDASPEELSAETLRSKQDHGQSVMENQLEFFSPSSSAYDSTFPVNSGNTETSQRISPLQSKSFTDSQEHLESINREELRSSLGILDDRDESNTGLNLAVVDNEYAFSPSEHLDKRMNSDYSEFYEAASLVDDEKLVEQEEVSTSSLNESKSVDSNIHSPSLTEDPPTNHVTNNTEADLSMFPSDSGDYIQKTTPNEDFMEDDYEQDEGPSTFQSKSNLYRSRHISLTEDTEDAAEVSLDFKSVDVNSDNFREDSQSPVGFEAEDTGNNNESELEYISEETISGQPQTSSPDNAVILPDSASRVSPEPSSPVDFDEHALQIASEIYLSRGLKSPRVFEIPPLETIPEHPPMTGFQEDSNYTPSDTSSMDVRYEEMFGGDSFEWDDFYGDSLIGKDLGLQHTPHQHNSVREYDVSDWSMDIDSESIASATSIPSQSEETVFSQPAHLPSQSNVSVDSDNSMLLCLDSVLSPQSKSTDSRETLVSSLLSQLQSPFVSSVSTANKNNFYSLTERYDLETDSSSDGLASPKADMARSHSYFTHHVTPLSPPASPPFSPSLLESSEQQNDGSSPVPPDETMSTSKSFNEDPEMSLENPSLSFSTAIGLLDNNSEMVETSGSFNARIEKVTNEEQHSSGNLQPVISILDSDATLHIESAFVDKHNVLVNSEETHRDAGVIISAELTENEYINL